ncbi:S26 family signal peptidase [Sphingomonas qomolangmaensis]|uniref:S26 family signal peptidase n=1 Tax=Sphingomonas qomolangmaensis TaxID=2918765 RepID=A0ABY5LAB4_9SPHN|nr:S26 family signal peptidase [Sphingomonas qomolangmaensis]UUL82563.1 S26 family signal peptidase [Sphingomonas qomolangmaensis]
MKAKRPPAEAPLLAWGEARFAHNQRKLRHLRLAILGGAAMVLLAAPAVYSPTPRLVWNASVSAPIGLYWVWPGGAVSRGDMAIAWAPDPWRTLAARRHYLPANVPLVKRVAAVPGDLVCAFGPTILVGGEPVATRLVRDTSGRSLPWWQGCHRLAAHEYLLLMDAPASFDGRYFGITNRRDFIGRVRLIWRR